MISHISYAVITNTGREVRVRWTGKRFELTRIDTGPVNFNEQMDQVFREIPAEGKRVKTNLARTLLEDRE